MSDLLNNCSNYRRFWQKALVVLRLIIQILKLIKSLTDFMR